jgi:hypothetical protein
MPNRHMKKCSLVLVIREIHTKIIMRYHLLPLTRAIIFFKSVNKMSGNWDLSHCKNAKWCRHYEKQYGGSLKIKTRMIYHMLQQLHFWLFCKRTEIRTQKCDYCAHVHCGIIYNSQDMEAA